MTAKPDPTSKKRILDDHKAIGALLAQCTSATEASVIHQSMTKLQALLGRHFAEEEAQLAGLDERPQPPAPRFANSVRGLIEEHRELLVSVRDLIDRAAQAQGDCASLRESSTALQARFVAHEARETEIFVESIWTDIGGGG